MMPGKRRSTDTIAAMLSSAPPLSSVPAQDPPGEPEPDPIVYEATAVKVQPAQLAPARDEDDLDDTDLEAFELRADAPLVRPRRRRAVVYQTVRINKPTAQVLRAQWLVARQQDPLLSYTEFATLVTQEGLRSLKELRERGQ